MSGGPHRPGPARWILRSAARLVPVHRRDAFLRQWTAELDYLRLHRRPTWPSEVRWALGAFAHAREVRLGEGTAASALFLDLRQAVRSLVRRPVPALVAVAIFAVGIGAANAVYAAVDALLLRPFPFPDPERLVSVDMRNPVLGMDQVSVTWPDSRDYLEAGPLESGAVHLRAELDLAGDGEPERVEVVRVSPGFFETLRADAVVGRLLDDGDQAVDAEPVVVLAEGLWERRYGRDPGIVGRTVRLDGSPAVVVGVVASAHRWPDDGDAWIPLAWGGSVPEWADSRSNFTWQMIARLSPGTTESAATAILADVTRAARPATLPEAEGAWTPRVAAFHRAQLGERVGLVAGLLVAAVLSLVLIASFNVAGLLLVRASERARDLSLRAALGAGRRRLFRQLLAESLILAAAGGIAGAAVAQVLLRLAAARLPEAGGRLAGVSLDGGVVALAMGVTVFAALVGGLAPALQGARAEISDALRDGGAGVSASRRKRRLQRGLVVAELALGTVLLLGAGMFNRAFRAAVHTDPGFDVEGVVVFSVRLPAARYASEAEVRDFFDRVATTLGETPGVDGVSATSTLPLGVGGMRLQRAFLLDGRPEPPDGPETSAQWIEVDPAYFATLGLRPLEGRVFGPDDGPGAPPVIVVNEPMARALRAEGSLVGRSLRSWRDENLPRTVVGVVPAVRMNDTELDATPLVLVPRAQAVRRTMAFLVRTDADVGGLLPQIRQRVAALDPDLALDGLSTLRARHRSAVAPVRAVTGIFSLFGVAALVLGTVGLYALVSFTVASQAREIGIRMAIGASRASVRGGVLAEGATLTGLGLVVGLALGVVFTRLVAMVLRGPGWLDPLLWTVVPAVLAVAMLAATALPAIRATRVDPTRALRSD